MDDKLLRTGFTKTVSVNLKEDEYETFLHLRGRGIKTKDIFMAGIRHYQELALAEVTQNNVA